jgi:hypothetical protein
MNATQIKDKLELDVIAKDHMYAVEPSCATTGAGIFEGLVSPLQSSEFSFFIFEFLLIFLVR